MADRALFFDTSVRAIIDMLAGIDAMCCDEATRYFKGLDSASFKERFRVLLGLSNAQIISLESSIKGNAQTTSTIRKCTDFLVNYVFSYIKGFDAKRVFEDERHFYMEREWRVANNVTFALTDVYRVFFPQRYAARFRVDLPDYFGQITFLRLSDDAEALVRAVCPRNREHPATKCGLISFRRVNCQTAFG